MDFISHHIIFEMVTFDKVSSYLYRLQVIKEEMEAYGNAQMFALYDNAVVTCAEMVSQKQNVKESFEQLQIACNNLYSIAVSLKKYMNDDHMISTNPSFLHARKFDYKLYYDIVKQLESLLREISNENT